MISLGLVGLGRWGKNYLTTISSMKGCQISHICAKNSTTLSKFSSDYHKTNYYQDLFKAKTLSGVIIATPAATHFQIARDFIIQRIPILVEKPLTTKLGEAIQLEKLAHSSGTLVMVGHQYLYNRAFLALKKIVKNIDKIKYIYTTAGNWGPFRQDVTVLWDYGPHDIAMLLDLMGGLPKSVATWGLDDVLCAKLNFTKVVCLINFNRKLPRKVRQMIIVSEGKNIFYDELAQRKLMTYGESVTKNIKIGRGTALEREIKAFVSAIKIGSLLSSDLRHAVYVITVLDALERSLFKDGQSVSLQ